jgi:hypothetical protein
MTTALLRFERANFPTILLRFAKGKFNGGMTLVSDSIIHPGLLDRMSKISIPGFATQTPQHFAASEVLSLPAD